MDIALELKWGTLKGWSLAGQDEAIELAKKYFELGTSASAMSQKDTPKQKEILCQLIDKVEGEIYLDWDGKVVSKQEAKDYIMNYGTDKQVAD